MSIKNGRLQGAVWKPLGPQTEPPIHPEVLIYHVIVGSLAAADAVFRAQGYTGDESTFGVGGPLDGSLDGVIWQWQDTRREADAQYAGNAYANSAEFSGFPNHPMSSKQLNAGIHIAVEFCRAHPGRKPHLVNKTGPIGDGAFGYHELREDWNTDGHICPGVIREAQVRTIIIPKARHIINGGHAHDAPPAPKPKPVAPHHTSGEGKIAVDGVAGAETIGAMQHILEEHGYYSESIDGIFGPHTRAALQLYLRGMGFYNGHIDSIFGHESVAALQEHIDAHIDGVWGHSTTRALQKRLNEGEF
jgi:lysozyme family protein